MVTNSIYTSPQQNNAAVSKNYETLLDFNITHFKKFQLVSKRKLVGTPSGFLSQIKFSS